MSWQSRLAERRGGEISETVARPTDKTDKSPFIGFVGTSSDRLEKITPLAKPFVGFVSTSDDRFQTTASVRALLLALADAQGIDPALVHRLDDEDIVTCLPLDERQLRTFLEMLHATATRRAGKVPPDDTAVIWCERCGPVWTQPSIASVLPVADGWPRALGCPWCFMRQAGTFVPRPPITCESCRHFQPDTINPGAGMGVCAEGHGRHRLMQSHRCDHFHPGEKVIP